MSQIDRSVRLTNEENEVESLKRRLESLEQKLRETQDKVNNAFFILLNAGLLKSSNTSDDSDLDEDLEIETQRCQDAENEVEALKRRIESLEQSLKVEQKTLENALFILFNADLLRSMNNSNE